MASGDHEFRFPITAELLEFFEQNIVEGGSGSCTVFMARSETMLSLKFVISATVDLICDVSLKPYSQAVEVEKELIIKFGEEEKELSEDVLVIHWDTQQLNVAEYIYEFLLLAVPMKRSTLIWRRRSDRSSFLSQRVTKTMMTTTRLIRGGKH